MSSIEHFNVVLVGAGISGIGVAHHLSENCPGKSFVMLEEKDTFGATWICAIPSSTAEWGRARRCVPSDKEWTSSSPARDACLT